MDDDDDLEFEAASGPARGVLHDLHGLAHEAICGRLVGVRITFGFQLVDAMRALELGELGARPYVEALRVAKSGGKPPAWS